MPAISNRTLLFYAAAFAAGIKILYLIFALITTGHDYDKPLIDKYFDSFKKNDTWWYERIAENGYPEISDPRDLGYADGPDFKQSEWAFFPLYPAINGITMRVTDLSFNYSAFFWSIIFSLLAAFTAMKYGLLYTSNAKQTAWFVAAMFLFPYSFYYSAFYTESLFLALLLGSFILIKKRQFYLLTLALIPLILLRPNGLVMLLPLYLFFLEQHRLADTKPSNVSQYLRPEVMRKSLSFAPAVIVFGLYCLYQYEMTGNFFAFSAAQKGWYREPMFPLLALFRHGDTATQLNSFFTIALMLFAGFCWKRLPFYLNVLVWIGILLPLSSGSVASMTRYTTTIFPLFIIIGGLIYQLKWKWGILVLLTVLHFASFYSWLINHELGY
jgi:hypothetical protein